MADANDFSIARLNASQADFDARLDALLAWDSVSDAGVTEVVAEILHQVKTRGDAALVEYTNRLDRRQVGSVAELVLTAESLQQALEQISPEQREALEHAARRIRLYHEHQKQSSWQYTEPDGTDLGQQVSAMERDRKSTRLNSSHVAISYAIFCLK